MSVAHAILGTLMEAPAHGYSIKKNLAAALPDEINDGQLYPALARMERQGWIRKQVVQQRRSPTKHLYRITDAGEREFFDWLIAVAEKGGEVRLDFFWKFDFLQRCAFFRHLEPEEVAQLVRAEAERVSAGLERLAELREKLRERDPDPYRDMVVEYGIRVQKVRRAWLQELLERATTEACEGSAFVAEASQA